MAYTKANIQFDGQELISDPDTFRDPPNPQPGGVDLDLIQVYSADVKDYGFKTQEEYIELLHKMWAGDTGRPGPSQEARETLILCFAKLGFLFVGRGMFSCLDIADIVSITNLVVIQMVDRAQAEYDLEWPFGSWVFNRVRWTLQDASRTESRIVKVHPSALARNRRIKRLEEQQGPQSNAEIAEKLDIPVNKVEAARLADAQSVPLDKPLRRGEDNSATVVDTLVAEHTQTPEQLCGTLEGRKLLHTLFQQHLTPFEARVMELTYGLDSDDPEQWTFRSTQEVNRIIGKEGSATLRNAITKARPRAIKKLAQVPNLKALLQLLMQPERIYGKTVIPPATGRTVANRKLKGRRPGKFSEETVRQIRRLHSEGLSVKAIADKYEINYHSCYAIAVGKYYTYVV